MRFIHIADIHMGMGFQAASFGHRKGTERRREIKETLLRTIKYCETGHIDLLLIAGDLFEDDYVALSDLKDINQCISALTQTRVLICAGNHDPIINGASPYTLVDWAPQVHLFSTELECVWFEDLNTEVWGFSWDKKHLPPLEIQKTLSRTEGRNKILMLHGDVYQKNNYLYIDRVQIKDLDMSYVALGHIHKTDFIEPWLAYPGSLEPLDFTESGQHGFIEGEIVDGQLTTAFVPFAKRAFHVVDIPLNGSMTYEGIVAHIKNRVNDVNKDDFYRIRLKGEIDPDVSLDLEDMENRLEDMVYYVEIRDQTELDLDLTQLEKDYRDTIVGAYITAMKDKGLENPLVEEALKKGLKILLEAQVMQ